METGQAFKISFYQIAVIGAIIGCILGLLPLLIGYLRKMLKIGILGFVGSAIGGAILGVFLSLPIVLLSIWFILKQTSEVNIINKKNSIIHILATTVGGLIVFLLIRSLGIGGIISFMSIFLGATIGEMIYLSILAFRIQVKDDPDKQMNESAFADNL